MSDATSNFDYEKFLSLSGLDLWKWMEPLLVDKSLRLQTDVLERLLSDLPTFRDEYHLVYALELLWLFAPEVVAKQAPRYLAHPQGSVYCAAHNILMRLPDSLLTPELLDDVEKVALTNPGNHRLQHTCKELRVRIKRARGHTNQSK